MLKIVVIGSGNVATHLAIALKKKGHALLQVYSPTAENAKKLSARLKCSYADSLRSIRKDADFYLISIKDEALPSLAKKLNLGEKLVVHTSGSVPMDMLKAVSKNFGVFYPLQTFSKYINPDFSKIPIFIEGNTPGNQQTLLKLAQQLAGKKNAVFLNSEQRKTMHLAAVFVNNFTNHLFAIAEDILNTNNLPFEALKPLIDETVNKIKVHAPSGVQTGPAKRGDKKIIGSHLKMLSRFPRYKAIYNLLSSSIAAQGKN